MTDEVVSEVATVDASAATVFRILADPTTHAAIDGTGWVRESLDGRKLSDVGQIFRMAMYHDNHPVGTYEMANQVTVFEPSRAIAWKPGQDKVGDGSIEYGGWVWRYDLTPLGPSQTRVTLTYDWSAVPGALREHIQFPPFPTDHLKNSLGHLGELAKDAAPALPPIVDQETWQRELDALRVREKAATRELDAIAAQRRRLPMVEMPDYTLDGEDGPVRLVDLFDGKRQLIVYHHMWFPGEEWQCPGCTGFTSQFTRLEFLDSYDARFVIVTQGPIDEALAYKRRVGNRMTWYSSANSPFGADVGAPPGGGFAVNVFLRDGNRVYRTWHTNGRGTEQLSHSFALIDILPYGRQEEWQDSPDGWPQRPTYSGWELRGNRPRLRRPTTRSKMTGLTTISLVCVPTPDQDKAVEFYESLGFEKRTDQPFGGGYRWIEVYPPEGTTGIALAPPPPDSGPVQPTNTGITLTTNDIDATHAAMKELGVDVDAQVARMGEPVPPMFWFRDPTGHTLMVVEV